jgi:hypothetical protein
MEQSRPRLTETGVRSHGIDHGMTNMILLELLILIRSHQDVRLQDYSDNIDNSLTLLCNAQLGGGYKYLINGTFHPTVLSQLTKHAAMVA